MCLAVLLAAAAATTATGTAIAATTVPGPVDLGGTRVEPSSNPSRPTELTAGLWADTLTGPGAPDANAHWFRYRRTMQYSSVLVGVVATSQEGVGSSDALEVEVTDPDGALCGSDLANNNYTVPGAAYGALVAVPADELGDREDPCLQADQLDIRVTRGTSTAEGELPIAIRVVEEAPVNGAEDDLPAVVESPTVGAPDPVEPRAVEGATSFDDAPTLTPGETIADAVVEGGQHLYRVRLGWGQALAVRVDVPTQDDAAAEALTGVQPGVDITLYDPLRNPFDTGHEDSDPDGSYGEEALRLFDGTRPVSLANRYDDSLMSVPGDYWVSVAVAPPSATDQEDGRPTVEVPVEVTVDVDGEVGGAPEFQGVALSPEGDAGPEDYDPARPYLVADGEFGADVSGTPSAADGTGDSADGVRRTAGLVVGAASLLSLLAGVVLLRRRASRPALSPPAAR